METLETKVTASTTQNMAQINPIAATIVGALGYASSFATIPLGYKLYCAMDTPQSKSAVRTGLLLGHAVGLGATYAMRYDIPLAQVYASAYLVYNALSATIAGIKKL